MRTYISTVVWDSTPIGCRDSWQYAFLFARIGDYYSWVIDKVVCIIQNKQ